VIGDPQQSIYGFRGSDSKYFKKFIDDYPDTEVVNLNRNYRSTQTILDASYQVVSPPDRQNTAERIYSQIKGPQTVSVLETASEKAEAVAISRTIERLIGGTGFHSIDFGSVSGHNPSVQRSFSDFAVLFRTADQSRVFCRVFDDGGIPYQIVSRDNFFSTKGVSELISFLKIIEDSASYADLVRIIRLTRPGIGQPSLEIFKRWSYQNSFTVAGALANARRFPIKGMSNAQQTKLNNFVELLENIKQQAKGLRLAEKLVLIATQTKLAEVLNSNQKTKEALNQLMDISQASNHNTSEFFLSTALQADTDIYEPRAEKVALMTMHAAKGLEFPVVFVVGCEKGYLPFQRSASETADIDEERRLFYVAMTRAQEQLYLTYAQKRRIYGKTEKRTPSPFVGAIEGRLKTVEKKIPGKPTKQGPAQLKLF
jgi:superfamily I DNA/RNA helicase